jgi:hypothetical protein
MQPPEDGHPLPVIRARHPPPSFWMIGPPPRLPGSDLWPFLLYLIIYKLKNGRPGTLGRVPGFCGLLHRQPSKKTALNSLICPIFLLFKNFFVFSSNFSSNYLRMWNIYSTFASDKKNNSAGRIPAPFKPASRGAFPGDPLKLKK